MSFERPHQAGRVYPWSKRPYSQKSMLPRRERGKRRSFIRRHYGLTRRQAGAIGAGHVVSPRGYTEAHAYIGLG